MGQAGGYQHLPRQLGESIGETGVVTMFTAIVLASAAVAGIHVAQPAPAQAANAQPTPQPAVQAAPAGVARPAVAIQPYVPAQGTGAAVPGGAGLPISTTSAAPGTTTLDTNTADDTIIDVADDSQQGGNDTGLSQAVTSLPADVQMLGYRLMWALAGLISLGGAAISWFMRDDEEDDIREAAPRTAPVPVGAPPPPERAPVLTRSR
jgi:hypothetical protein